VAPAGRTAGDTGGDSAVGPQPDALSGAPPLIVDELEGAPASGGDRFGSRGDREGAAAIAIRDQRGEHAPAEWLEAIARELERHEPQELPFAVLLVELRDLEGLRLQSTPASLAADLAALERVLSENGSVVRERPGRYWVLVPGADRHGARALAEALHAGLSEAGSGESLRALIGLAVYPADGRHAAALAAHADVDLIAARSARR
jgi:GGDEF domain-containing protein